MGIIIPEKAVSNYKLKEPTKEVLDGDKAHQALNWVMNRAKEEFAIKHNALWEDHKAGKITEEEYYDGYDQFQAEMTVTIEEFMRSFKEELENAKENVNECTI